MYLLRFGTLFSVPVLVLFACSRYTQATCKTLEKQKGEKQIPIIDSA
jgi:hypothetical protein